MRSFGVLKRHSSHAALRRVDRALDVLGGSAGTSAIASPVAGLRTSIVSPLDDSTHSPPMKCLCWVTETLTNDLRSVKSR